VVHVFAYIVALLAGACCVFLGVSEWLAKRDSERNRRQLRVRVGAPDGASAPSVPSAEGRCRGSSSTRESRALSSPHPSAESPFARLLAQTPFAAAHNKRAKVRLAASYERDLPAMLEIIALGMHAGMGFDQAFELYAKRYDTTLAHICRDSHAIWQRGLTSREKGMRELSDKIGVPSFARFTSTALRALRFGAPMTQLLDDLAQETRREYRAKREEMVAKAPVKMLLPTGGLILPAMLLLVMGPILLDLIGKLG